MLLEAYHLLKNRIGQGQSNSPAHESSSIDISKGFRTWRLVLNSGGSIHGIAPMGDADAPGYWSLIKGTSAKEKRFPALRPKRPPLVLPLDDDRWKTIEDLKKGNVLEVRELLVRLAEDVNVVGAFDLTDAWYLKAAPILHWQATQPETELLAYLKECVHAFGRFCGREENLNWEYSTNEESIGRERKVELEQRRLSESKSIATHLVREFVKLVQSETDVNQIKVIAASLLGVRKKNKRKEVVGLDFSTELCVDLHLPNSLGSTIYTPRMRTMVLGQLGSLSGDDESPGVCAISGNIGNLLKSKLPLWNGSPIFKSPPYAKFKAAPCNQRYGKFELDGFDISADLARQLVGGLNAQTVAGKEWKTWVKLRNGKFKKQAGKKPLPQSDLMLAYPSFDVEGLVTVDVFVQPRFDDSPGAKYQAKVFVDCAERLLL